MLMAWEPIYTLKCIFSCYWRDNQLKIYVPIFVFVANINDRSLLGKKDSEVSVIIEDTDMVGLML